MLISPIAIGHPDWSAQLLPVSLTKAQVKGEQRHRHQKPVSRQREAALPQLPQVPRTTGEAPVCGAWARTRAA